MLRLLLFVLPLGLHSVLVAFSVAPPGVGEIVAEAVRVVRESGLANRTDAMFTLVEGES